MGKLLSDMWKLLEEDAQSKPDVSLADCKYTFDIGFGFGLTFAIFLVLLVIFALYLCLNFRKLMAFVVKFWTVQLGHLYTLIIQQHDHHEQYGRALFEACEIYLSCKAKKLKCKLSDNGALVVSLPNGLTFTEFFDGVPILWTYTENLKSRYFVLSLEEKYKREVLDRYLRSVQEFYDGMKGRHEEKTIVIKKILNS